MSTVQGEEEDRRVSHHSDRIKVKHKKKERVCKNSCAFVKVLLE